MSGNTTTSAKTSMAEELMVLISDEEYVKTVSGFPGSEYLNQTDVSTVKKTISGKLWLDNRKFVSRQQNIVVNGLYALFGVTLGKPATEIRTEAYQFMIDVENTDIRKMMRHSINQSGKNYDTWIRRLASNDFPCDEFGLFVLSYVYKWHVTVVLSKSVWCTFKTGSMSTFEKLCKSDHVLVWLGEDRYAEAKPLQLKGRSGNRMDWQVLSESIDFLHEKNITSKNYRRVKKCTASVSTPKKTVTPRSVSPSRTRQGTKRRNSVSIDYKQLHEEGVLEVKKRYTSNLPPLSSGPSESRLHAQMVITKKNQAARKVVTASHAETSTSTSTTAYVPLRHVSVDETTKNIKDIKQEHTSSRYSSRIVKPEPRIFMRHRRNPQDTDRQWRFVHVSGRPCNQGGDRDCNSQSENEETDALPDLVTNTPQSSKSVNTRSSATTDVEIVSPPAVVRQLHAPPMNKPTRTQRSLGDLLCTLNFDQIPTTAVDGTTAQTASTELTVPEVYTVSSTPILSPRIPTVIVEDTSPSTDDIQQISSDNDSPTTNRNTEDDRQPLPMTSSLVNTQREVTSSVISDQQPMPTTSSDVNTQQNVTPSVAPVTLPTSNTSN